MFLFYDKNISNGDIVDAANAAADDASSLANAFVFIRIASATS